MFRIIFYAILTIWLGSGLPGLYASTCETVASTSDIFECAFERHPQLRQALLEERRATAGLSKAGQLLNPELEADGVYGRSLGDDLIELDGALMIPIELGGKRSARKALAGGELTLAQARLYETKVEVARELVAKLVELRQIHFELEVIAEGLGTFNQVISRYQKRPSLSPEDEVALEVFKLAKADYELHRTDDLSQKNEVEMYLFLATGLAPEKISNFLPTSRVLSDWPKFESPKTSDELKSPELLIAEAELKKARAEYDLEKSESWPTVALGPRYVYGNEGGLVTHQYGAALSLPLPLFSMNRGGRELGRRGEELASHRLSTAKQESSLTYERLLKKYADHLSLLSRLPSLESVQKSHARIDRQVKRGLVSSALIIEAHRQLLDFVESYHEQEREAYRILWSIYGMEGVIDEVDF